MSLLIGLVDQEINVPDKVSWSDSKIGGQPVWMSKSVSPAIQNCQCCATPMTLVVQLYCPLSHSAYHRCLYVLVCASAGCSHYNSWKVFRSMQYDESYAPSKSERKKDDNSKLFDEDMWADDQDDWGDDDDDNDDNDDDNNDALGAAASNDFSTDSSSSNYVNIVTNTFYHSFNSGNPSPSLPDTSTLVQPRILSSDKKGTNGNGSAESKEVSGRLSSHDATDQDLSACFSTMDVEENQDKAAEAGGGALMEDLAIPDTSRLDQLASVLNTKYAESSVVDQSSSRRPVQLKPYFLSVVDGISHDSCHTADDGHIASLIREYEEVEGKQIKDIISDRAQTKGKGASEGYEKSSVKHGDKVFHKFWKEIRKVPEQCIRYDRGGDPLLVQSLSPVQAVIPPCPKCGASRVFELQLVPAIIPWLCSQEDKPPDIEFGSILVYTCDKSCPPSSGNDVDVFEEHVILQHDPDHHLYR